MALVAQTYKVACICQKAGYATALVMQLCRLIPALQAIRIVLHEPATGHSVLLQPLPLAVANLLHRRPPPRQRSSGLRYTSPTPLRSHSGHTNYHGLK